MLNLNALPIPEPLANFALGLIGERIRALTGSSSRIDDFTVPAGDVGLFGPQSVTWKVHANFTAMMVGGLSSLMVQSLHPRALSAVWDHSDFQKNLKERLGRTSYFVAATTYGSENMAMGAIQRVNAIHANIRGTDLDGNPYVANEPALIRWVHIAEVYAFLSAYQHLATSPLTPAECDQYIDEMSRIGHLLGAVDLPLTWQATQAALADYVGELRFDTRARATFKVIENYPTTFLDKPFMHLMLKAAFDVMPTWVLPLIERQPACAVQVQLTKFALNAASEPIQWALDQHGVCAVAQRRVNASVN